MKSPEETPTEKRYRMVCDMVNDRVGEVMSLIRYSCRSTEGLQAHQGDILADLAAIQGILFKVCAAGVRKDKDEFLDIIIGSFKEIPK